MGRRDWLSGHKHHMVRRELFALDRHSARAIVAFYESPLFSLESLGLLG